MGPVAAITDGLSNLNNFSGRSSRSAYWWMSGFTMVAITIFQRVSIALTGVDALPPQFEVTADHPLTQVFFSIFTVSFLLVCLLMLACTARRFQDHGWSGRWFRWMMYLCWFVIGLILLFASRAAFTGGAVLTSVPPWLFLLLFPPFASIVWTFWIGFVRPEPTPNIYGPNPQEVST